MRIESYRAGVFSLPTAEVDDTPQVSRTEKKLKILLPPGFEDSRPDETDRVIKAMEQIRIVEYDSNQPGGLVFVGAGMHGEETHEESLSIVERLDMMLNKQTELVSGVVILIPNLNAPGCIYKTRHVFADESNTNLNDIFNCCQTGDWNEFFALGTKTEKYAWLFMKYLTTKRGEHGLGQPVTYFDLHAEETAIPHIRIDRMFEQQEPIERLLGVTWQIGIPAILEYVDWEKIGYHTSLSAVATQNGMNAVTIEEGRTIDPDLYTRLYIAYQLFEYLRQQGMITLTEERQESFNEEFSPRYAPPSFRNALELWKSQRDRAEILCLDDILSAIIHEDGRTLSPRQLLRTTLDKEGWDGVLSLSYRVGLRGIRGGADISLAAMAFGRRPSDRLGRLRPSTDAHLWLTKFPETSWIVSIPESPDPQNRIIYYAFFETTDEKTGEPKIQLNMLQKPDESTFLVPKQLEALLEANPKIGVDVNILEMTCAVPDPKWKGELKAENIIISPKDG